MKATKNLFPWLVIISLPLLLGAGGTQCFGHLCPLDYDIIDLFKLPSGVSVVIRNQGIIDVVQGRCSQDSLLQRFVVPGQPNLRAVDYDHVDLFFIIVGDSGTLARLEPDSVYQISYPFNPAGKRALRAVYIDDPYVVAVGDSGTVIKSTNSGQTWTHLTSYPTSANLSYVVVHSSLYYEVGGNNYNRYATTDGGATWFNQAGPEQLPSGFGVFGPMYYFDENHGFLGGPYGGSIFRTTNGGVTWLSTSVNGFTQFNAFFFVSPDSGIVVGSPGAGVATTNGGVTWYQDATLTTFLNGRTIRKIIPYNRHLGMVLGEAGLNMVVADDSSLLTAIWPHEELPTSYELLQNYPNPFNPTTRIGYSIPQRGLVTLTVYDVLGRTVATLVNEEKSVGRHEIDFDGSGLASGVYYYRLHATSPNGGFTQTRKFVLMK